MIIAILIVLTRERHLLLSDAEVGSIKRSLKNFGVLEHDRTLQSVLGCSKVIYLK